MIPLPRFIIKELQAHILGVCPRAQNGWEFSNQDEDTITGDFLGNMRTDWNSNQNYEWRFGYNKVRGRGKGALEKIVGTDGIITIHYKNQSTGENYYKSLVFQAKKVNNKVDYEQWDKMKMFFPKGNAIFSYGPNGYKSYYDDQSTELSICELLARKFLECKIGIEGLYYDHTDNKFVRPTNIPLKGKVKQELMIEVFKNP